MCTLNVMIRVIQASLHTSQVVVVAKKFLSLLDKVAYETDDELRVGCIFLLCAEELCEVYKVYCSNHNVAAEPLLKKVRTDFIACCHGKYI